MYAVRRNRSIVIWLLLIPLLFASLAVHVRHIPSDARSEACAGTVSELLPGFLNQMPLPEDVRQEDSAAAQVLTLEHFSENSGLNRLFLCLKAALQAAWRADFHFAAARPRHVFAAVSWYCATATHDFCAL